MIWIISIISAVFYRIGGAGGFKNNKLVRRLGCPLLQFIAIFFILKISAPWWVHLLGFGITYAGITTYHDWTGKDNHYLHALGISLGLLLYAYVGSITWIAFILRSIVLILFMGIWERCWRWDVMAELGRGFAIPFSLLLLTL